MAYKLTQIRVRRVLECMRSYKRKSLSEITLEFNRRYPPSMIRKIIGIKVKERDILGVLNFLVEQKFVEKQLFRFTNQALPMSEQMYCLTQEGIRYLGSKH